MEIITKLRKTKRKVNMVFNMLKGEVDLNSNFISSRILEELSLLSKVDEELTDIIYLVIDNKNSQK